MAAARSWSGVRVGALEERKYVCAYATVRAESSHPPDRARPRLAACSPGLVRVQYSHYHSVVRLWVWARALVRVHERVCAARRRLSTPRPPRLDSDAPRRPLRSAGPCPAPPRGRSRAGGLGGTLQRPAPRDQAQHRPSPTSSAASGAAGGPAPCGATPLLVHWAASGAPCPATGRHQPQHAGTTAGDDCTRRGTSESSLPHRRPPSAVSAAVRTCARPCLG